MRVRLLREAGGLGDVIRTLGCARALKEHDPSCYIGYYVLSGFQGIVRLCPDIDKIYLVKSKQRRPRDAVPDALKFPYLRSGGQWDASASLYCPAWRHEASSFPNVTRDRLENFTLAASAAVGVDLPVRLPWIALDEYTRGQTQGWLEARQLDRAPYVVIQTHAAQTERRWPLEKWVAMLEIVHKARPDVNFLEITIMRSPSKIARTLRIEAACSLSTPLLCGLIKNAAVVVGPDSGLLHVAGAFHTPAVGIYGITAGENIARYYPEQIRIDPLHEDRAAHRCGKKLQDRPCWNVGKPRECLHVACHAMNAIAPERVAMAVLLQLEGV